MHPGLGGEESRAIDPDGWRVRLTVYAFPTSPAARELPQQEGMVVTDYRAVQQLWAGGQQLQSVAVVAVAGAA